MSCVSCALSSSRLLASRWAPQAGRQASRSGQPQRAYHQRTRAQRASAQCQEDADVPTTSGRWDPLELHALPAAPGAGHLAAHAASAAALVAAAAVLLPAGAAHANETAPDGMLEFIISSIEALGPWGPAAFVATVAIAECIPLFPTQPLSLASGLLFGAQKGALCILSGGTLAALLAFSIARGIGRPLAERIIRHELPGGSEGEGKPEGVVAAKLAEVTSAIERGSFWQQAGAVLLLRMTPVVPFSASNYVLGLSPLPLAPYLAGTVAGTAFWSVFYASLGGASRSLLRSGVDPDVLLADLLERAGSYTRELAVAGALLAAAGVLYAGAGLVRRQLGAADEPGSSGSSEGGGRRDQAGGSSEAGGGGQAAELLSQGLSRGAAAGQELVAEQAAQLRQWLGAAAERAGRAKELAEPSQLKD